MTATNSIQTSTRSPFERLLRFQLRRLWRTTALFWLNVVVIWAIVVAVLLNTGVFQDTRLWELGSAPITASKAFLLVMGILTASVDLPIFVAHGVTRRHVAGASLLLFGGVAILFSVLTPAYSSIEAALLVAYDQPVGSFLPAGSLPAFLGGVALMHLLYAGSGFLIGSLYFRFGGWRGNLLAIPSLIPLIAGEVVTHGDTPDSVFRSSWLPTPAGAATVVAAILIVLVASFLVVRDIPMRKITS